MSNYAESLGGNDGSRGLRAQNGNAGILGNGMLFSREVNYRSDLSLVRRALRERWPMKPEDCVRLWAKVAEIRAQFDGRIARAAEAALAEFRRTDFGSKS